MTKLILSREDITKLKVEAVVNAANSALAGGGGVDGAIHRAAGNILYEECKAIINKIGSLPAGEAIVTSAGKMNAKYIVHTVGPIWRGGAQNEAEILRNAYLNSLEVAKSLGVKTIAFPNISTGVYGYPKESAANIAIDAVREFIKNDETFEEIFFVCFDDENFNLYSRLLINK